MNYIDFSRVFFKQQSTTKTTKTTFQAVILLFLLFFVVLCCLKNTDAKSQYLVARAIGLEIRRTRAVAINCDPPARHTPDAQESVPQHLLPFASYLLPSPLPLTFYLLPYLLPFTFSPGRWYCWRRRRGWWRLEDICRRRYRGRWAFRGRAGWRV